jgi:hypothetical protein
MGSVGRGLWQWPGRDLSRAGHEGLKLTSGLECTGSRGLAPGRIPCQQGTMQGSSRISADFRKNRSEKPNDSRRFRDNSLRGRTGRFFGRSGNESSLIGRKQGYRAHSAPPVRRFPRASAAGAGQSRETTGLGPGCGSPTSQMRPTRRSFEASALCEEAATPAPPRQASAPGTQCRPPTAIEPRLR